jgi:hypothetical protein
MVEHFFGEIAEKHVRRSASEGAIVSYFGSAAPT